MIILLRAGDLLANARTSESDSPSSPRRESVASRYPPVASICPVSYTHLDVYKRQMLSSNASVTVAANGVLDIETTGGQYARGVELGTSMTYPDAFDRRFTAAAGSTLRVKTCLLYTSRCV